MTDKATHSPEPWNFCGHKRGGCSCGQIWSTPADCPVASVTSGEWGDSYPVIRIVNKDESASASRAFELVLKADTERIDYGSIPEDVAKANMRRIVACVNACKGVSTYDLEQGRLTAKT